MCRARPRSYAAGLEHVSCSMPAILCVSRRLPVPSSPGAKGSSRRKSPCQDVRFTQNVQHMIDSGARYKVHVASLIQWRSAWDNPGQGPSGGVGMKAVPPPHRSSRLGTSCSSRVCSDSSAVFDGGMHSNRFCMPPSNRTVQRSTCASSSASSVHFGARTTAELG